jgi:hypothetical protein
MTKEEPDEAAGEEAWAPACPEKNSIPGNKEQNKGSAFICVFVYKVKNPRVADRRQAFGLC